MKESEEQKEIVLWFRGQWPQYQKSLRPSMSGLNYGSGKRGAILSRHAKSQGVVAGESDLAILLPRGGFGSLLIELKAADSHYQASENQLQYIRYHNSVGNCACVAKGVDMAKAAIKQYMEMKT